MSLVIFIIDLNLGSVASVGPIIQKVFLFSAPDTHDGPESMPTKKSQISIK